MASPALRAGAEAEAPAGGRRRACRRPDPDGVADDAGKVEFGAPLDPRCTFENFVVGKPNELAHAAARRVAEAGRCPSTRSSSTAASAWARPTSCTPSPGRCGSATPKRRVLYLSAEQFMYQFVSALRFKDTMAFKEKFRSVDVLMVDDVQFISGKDSTQEEFFHTFNALVEQQKQIVISADKRARARSTGSRSASARASAGAGRRPPSHRLRARLGILQSKAEAQLKARRADRPA